MQPKSQSSLLGIALAAAERALGQTETLRGLVEALLAKDAAPGPKGEAGTPGPAGPKGERGDLGPQGKAAIGMVGPAGADGVPGSVGPKGAAGEAGPQGEAGPEGDRGPSGPAGPGPASQKIDKGGDLYAIYTDGREQNVGHVVGRAGKDGKDGQPGPQGPQGPRGADGGNEISVGPPARAFLEDTDPDRLTRREVTIGDLTLTILTLEG